jgi:hypothetical protein
MYHHIRDHGVTGLNFSLDPVVTKALLATKIQNLEEFRFLFEDESEVDTFLSKLQLGDDMLIQGSRLRRAWTAVTLYYKNQGFEMSRRIFGYGIV